MNKENATRKASEGLKAADALKEVTQNYFEMLNKSLSECNNHKSSNRKELKRGARITEHRISL